MSDEQTQEPRPTSSRRCRSRRRRRPIEQAEEAITAAREAAADREHGARAARADPADDAGRAGSQAARRHLRTRGRRAVRGALPRPPRGARRPGAADGSACPPRPSCGSRRRSSSGGSRASSTGSRRRCSPSRRPRRRSSRSCSVVVCWRRTHSRRRSGRRAAGPTPVRPVPLARTRSGAALCEVGRSAPSPASLIAMYTGMIEISSTTAATANTSGWLNGRVMLL